MGELLPDTPRAVFESGPHLNRHSWNPTDDAYLCTIGSWVVHSAGRTILVDTGVEHVTPRADHDCFDPGAGRLRAPRTEDAARRFAGVRLVFEGSIAPLAGTGRLSSWSEHLDLGGGVRLQSTPGHTPGSAAVWLEEVDQRAVFVGDLLHAPAQVARPGDRISFDLDPDSAAASRRAVLQGTAATTALVSPAHFGGTGAIHVEDDGANSCSATEVLRDSSPTL